MKLTTEAKHLQPVLETKIAVLTTDIAEAEKKAKALEPEAEQSEQKKKALTVIRQGIDRAQKLRQSLVMLSRTIQGVEVNASCELNDNECAVLGYIDAFDKAEP